MTLEVIGYLWVLAAAVISIGALRATYLEWCYNHNITKEKTWLNAKTKTQQSSDPSKPPVGSTAKSTLNGEATWSLGVEVLERSLSIGKSNRIREPAAENGSKE